MSLTLGELSEKVLDVYREAVENHDLSPEDMLKCSAMMTASFMSEMGAVSCNTPAGTLNLDEK